MSKETVMSETQLGVRCSKRIPMGRRGTSKPKKKKRGGIRRAKNKTFLEGRRGGQAKDVIES